MVGRIRKSWRAGEEKDVAAGGRVRRGRRARGVQLDLVGTVQDSLGLDPGSTRISTQSLWGHSPIAKGELKGPALKLYL